MIYAGATPDVAAETARQLGISYIFIGPEERNNRSARRHWQNLTGGRISFGWCFRTRGRVSTKSSGADAATAPRGKTPPRGNFRVACFQQFPSSPSPSPSLPSSSRAPGRWPTFPFTCSRRFPGGRSGGRCSDASHPVAWIAGALLGYALTCLALWAVLAIGIASALTFAAAWAGMSATTWSHRPASGQTVCRAARVEPSRGANPHPVALDRPGGLPVSI